MVMELCDDTLRRYLDQTGDTPIPREERIDILTQVAKGLVCIHDKGLVHLDLKAENVMYRGSNLKYRVYKIADYGISNFLDTFRGVCARSGMHAHLTNFDAPERVPLRTDRGSSQASPTRKMDIYSYGCFIFELLTKKMPFEGQSEQEIVYAKTIETKKLSGSLPEDERRGLGTLMDKCMLYDGFKLGGDRPTAQQVVDQLSTMGSATRANPLEL